MRIGIGYIIQETNSFSPIKSRLEDFSIVFGGEVLGLWENTRTEIGGFCDVLSRSGAEIVPLFAGWAMTAGPIREDEFATMKSLVADATRKAGTLDGISLALHGAMCAEDTDDCEGALLESLRGVLGTEFPIVLTLDLHANITRKLVENADGIIGYKTYPHIDTFETGQAGAQLLLRILKEGIRPVTVMQKIPLIVPAENMQTTKGPMAEIFTLGEAFRREHPEILCVSVFGVQPWLDIGEMGCSTVVVSNQDSLHAKRCAVEMAKQFWASRDAFEVELLTPREAIQAALREKGQPVVLSESSDSPTAGSPGDSAELLQALLEYAPGTPSAVWVRDEMAVAKCWEDKPGARTRIDIGGTIDRTFRRPISTEVVIRSLSDGRFFLKGAWNTGMAVAMGHTAVVESNEVTIVLSEGPVSMIDPQVYRSQGIEPRDKKIVVVKSANGFRSEYGPFASKIIMVDTLGVSSANLRSLPYDRVSRPIYPLDRVEFEPDKEVTER